MVQGDWEKFLLGAVESFRKDYELLTAGERKFLKGNPDSAAVKFSFMKPCQIILIDFVAPLPLVLIVVHDPQVPDLRFQAYERIANVGHFFKASQETRPLFSIDLNISDKLRAISSGGRDQPPFPIARFANPPESNSVLMAFGLSEARDKPEFIADSTLGFVQYLIRTAISEEEKKRIGSTADTLRRNATKIADLDLRRKVIESSDEIQDALQEIRRLDEYEKKLDSMKTEIVGVRKLIGASKEFQDFVVLTSTVDDIKKDHVGRVLFDETVRRLDERINGLGKRMDDLRETKLWSKRTVVDIVLAIIAIIATLLASGYLHL